MLRFNHTIEHFHFLLNIQKKNIFLFGHTIFSWFSQYCLTRARVKYFYCCFKQNKFFSCYGNIANIFELAHCNIIVQRCMNRHTLIPMHIHIRIILPIIIVALLLFFRSSNLFCASLVLAKKQMRYKNSRVIFLTPYAFHTCTYIIIYRLLMDFYMM